MNIAERIFVGERAKGEIEDELFDLGVIFEDTTYDEYDNSLELFDVPDDQRLSFEAQQVVYNAGFSIIYLNHKNKWETHYKFATGPFEEDKGWRVSYPQKRGKDEKGIWVEEKVNSWPSEWFETGYAQIIPGSTPGQGQK